MQRKTKQKSSSRTVPVPHHIHWPLSSRFHHHDFVLPPEPTNNIIFVCWNCCSKCWNDRECFLVPKVILPQHGFLELQGEPSKTWQHYISSLFTLQSTFIFAIFNHRHFLKIFLSFCTHFSISKHSVCVSCNLGIFLRVSKSNMTASLFAVCTDLYWQRSVC